MKEVSDLEMEIYRLEREIEEIEKTTNCIYSQMNDLELMFKELKNEFHNSKDSK